MGFVKSGAVKNPASLEDGNEFLFLLSMFIVQVLVKSSIRNFKIILLRFVSLVKNRI
jgi:hypothetical protein